MAGLFWQRQSHNIEQNYIIDDIADSITVTGTDSNIWLTQQQRTDRDQAAFGEVYFDVTDKLSLTGGIRAYKYKNSLEGFFGFSGGYSSKTGEAACLNTDGTTRKANPRGTPVPILVPRFRAQPWRPCSVRPGGQILRAGRPGTNKQTTLVQIFYK